MFVLFKQWQENWKIPWQTAGLLWLSQSNLGCTLVRMMHLAGYYCSPALAWRHQFCHFCWGSPNDLTHRGEVVIYFQLIETLRKKIVTVLLQTDQDICACNTQALEHWKLSAAPQLVWEGQARVTYRDLRSEQFTPPALTSDTSGSWTELVNKTIQSRFPMCKLFSKTPNSIRFSVLYSLILYFGRIAKNVQTLHKAKMSTELG